MVAGRRHTGEAKRWCHQGQVHVFMAHAMEGFMVREREAATADPQVCGA